MNTFRTSKSPVPVFRPLSPQSLFPVEQLVLTPTDRQLLVAWSSVKVVSSRQVRRLLILAQVQQLELAECWKSSKLWSTVLGLSDEQSTELQKFQKKFTPASYEEWLHSHHIHTVTEDEAEYPQLLLHCDDRPLVLFYYGAATSWAQTPIAVVGTRKMTPYGVTATTRIVQGLVRQGASIISGFMHGIDTQAHVTTLKNQGVTVGVVGYGLSKLSQQRHAYLVAHIVAHGGAILSELPYDAPATRYTFPLRNRLIAGMSHATVVVEAGLQSGSLITAQRAVDYNRTVCGVPGPLTNRYSEGTKWLVNEGAYMVTSGEDVFEFAQLQPNVGVGWGIYSQTKSGAGVGASVRAHPTQRDYSSLPPIERRIMTQLVAQATATDELGSICHLPIDELNVRLSLLELQGIIHRVGEVWLPI